jgi:hypothetical protein
MVGNASRLAGGGGDVGRKLKRGAIVLFMICPGKHGTATGHVTLSIVVLARGRSGGTVDRRHPWARPHFVSKSPSDIS